MNLGTAFLVYTEEIFPFCHIEKKKSNISKSLSKPSPSLVKLINQLNNVTRETKDYDKNLPNCQYRDLGGFQDFSEKYKSKSLSFARYQRILMTFVYYSKKLT